MAPALPLSQHLLDLCMPAVLRDVHRGLSVRKLDRLVRTTRQQRLYAIPEPIRRRDHQRKAPRRLPSPENAPLGAISYKVLIYYGIKFTTQIGAVFAEPHWPAQPAMIGYTL